MWFRTVMMLQVVGFFSALPAMQDQGDFPKPVGYVNDFAGVISADASQRIDRIIREVKQKTGAEIALVTMSTVGENHVVQEYANLLFERWGIGEKGKDNGLLILNFIEDRRLWIEVGYGLEGILPDGYVGEIEDRYFIPYLRDGDYSAAYETGVAAIAGVIARDAGVVIDGTLEPSPRPQTNGGGGGLGKLIWLFILFLIISGAIGRRRRSAMMWGPWLFGGFGGGFGGGFRGGGSSGGGGFGGFGGGFSGGGGAGRSY